MEDCKSCVGAIACSIDEFRVCNYRKLPIQPTVADLLKKKKEA